MSPIVAAGGPRGESGIAKVGAGEDEGRGGGKPVIVKPVANAIGILRFLSESGKPARAVQIARHLSINSSTCFNILRTLVSEGVVEFDSLSKSYKPGIGLARLVSNALSEGQRLSAAKPLMHELAAKHGVTLSLWRRVGAQRIILVTIEHSPSDLRVHMAEGQRLPMLMGASGRILAPHLGMTKSALKAQFKTLRWQRPISFDTYWAQVEAAGELGYAVDDGYFTRGIMTIAAPVFDPGGNPAFTVSAVMFQGQFDEDHVAELGRELVELAPRLSSVLY
jgi:DNA-binding IclR family transcriptional regulator